MKAKINSVTGLDVNVTFTFDDASMLTQNINVGAYKTNSVDADGNVIVIAVDPMEDLASFLRQYAAAYQAGEQDEADRTSAINEYAGQTITL